MNRSGTVQIMSLFMIIGLCKQTQPVPGTFVECEIYKPRGIFIGVPRHVRCTFLAVPCTKGDEVYWLEVHTCYWGTSTRWIPTTGPKFDKNIYKLNVCGFEVNNYFENLVNSIYCFTVVLWAYGTSSRK